MTVREKYFPLTGGMDMVTHAIAIPPGRMIVCKNYEQGPLGGYTRIEGFERCDGHELPSEMSYWLLNFTGGNIELVSDQNVVGQTSGAMARILDHVLESGTFAGGDAVGYAVLYRVSGNFEDQETVSIGGADDGFCVGFSGGYG